MNFEQEIKVLLRKTIMDEIDALAVKATLRDYVETVVTKEDISERVNRIIDSYFRSAMSKMSVEEYIKRKIDNLVETAVKKEVDKIIKPSYWGASDRMKRILEDQVDREIRKGFDVSVEIKPREGKQ